MKSRRNVLAALGGALFLSGCTSDDGTAPTSANPPTESSPTTTATASPTDTETPADTPEETETPADTPTPERKSFDEIYQEEMTKDAVDSFVDWDSVRTELEEDGHDLDNLEVTSEFIEDLAGHAGSYVPEESGALVLAHGLYEEFDIGTDQVIVDPRQFFAGQGGPMASVLIQNEDGAVHKDMYRPLGSRQLPDEGGDVVSYARHDEEIIGGAEETVYNVWDSTGVNRDIFSWLDIDGLRNMPSDWLEAYKSEEDGTDVISSFNDDIIVGYHPKMNVSRDETEEGGEVVYTIDAYEKMSEVIDPKNVNAEPYRTGQMARDLVIDASKAYYNDVNPETGDFLAIDYSDSAGFQFDIVGRDRKEELEHRILTG